MTRIFQRDTLRYFLIAWGLILVWICFGQEGTNSAPQYTESDLTKNIIEIFDLIFGLLALVLWPMVILAGWLLSPDWTMGDFFGLRGYFKEVWILVANIVYIIFALMLLYMAIMQIFGWSESEYAFKKKLPSFLVGILLVPFTWLIVSWTLSFANQAVAAVLSIPMGSIAKLDTGSSSGEQDKSKWHQKMLPTQFDFSTNSSGYGVHCSEWVAKDKDGNKIDCISPAEFLTKNQAGPFFIIMIYAYNIFKIQDADKNAVEDFCVDQTASGETKYKTSKDCIKDLVGIVRKFWLSLIVTIFFAIMLVALCWILLMRAIKLWIYIMLSPLFGLAYFTGKMSEGVWEAGEMWFWWLGFKPFFKLAMVPVLVSAVLAFGLLFVWVVRDNFHGGTKNPGQTEFCTDDKVGYMVTYCIEEIKNGEKTTFTSKLIIGTDTNKSDGDSTITLNFGDAFSNIIGWAEAASALSGGVAGGIESVEDIFAHIILTMMALVFMFMGVKVAANFDPVTEAAFKPFQQLGEATGKFIAHSPSYLPLPHPAFGAVTNPAMISHAAQMITSKITNDNANLGRSLHDIVGWKTAELDKAVDNLWTASGSLKEVSRALENMEYKTPKQANEAILKAIDNSLLPETKNDPEVQKFKAALEADPNGKHLAQNIERFDKAIEKMEADPKTQWIWKIGGLFGAQTEAASQPFHNVKLDTESWNIKLWTTDVIKKDWDSYTSTLNPEQKIHIQSILPKELNVNAIQDKKEIENLFKKAFPELNIDEGKLSWAEKKKMLEALKTSANN